MIRFLSLPLLSGFLALFSCTSAFAQCGAINTGGGNCTPPTAPGMPGYSADNTASNVAAQATYVTQWGAIAIDDILGRAGAVTDRVSEREAKKDALEACEAKGGTKCEVALAYDNECAAVAWVPGYRSATSAPTKEEAEDNAVDRCNKKGGGCEVVYSACSLPRRID
jgi:hypothetical protein